MPKPGKEEERAVKDPLPLLGIRGAIEHGGQFPSPWTLEAVRWSELPGGRTSSLLAAWVLEGRLPSGRERRSRRRSPWAGACCHPP